MLQPGYHPWNKRPCGSARSVRSTVPAYNAPHVPLDLHAIVSPVSGGRSFFCIRDSRPPDCTREGATPACSGISPFNAWPARSRAVQRYTGARTDRHSTGIARCALPALGSCGSDTGHTRIGGNGLCKTRWTRTRYAAKTASRLRQHLMALWSMPMDPSNTPPAFHRSRRCAGFCLHLWLL